MTHLSRSNIATILVTSLLITACGDRQTSAPAASRETPASAPALLRKPAPESAQVYIINPTAGAQLSNPVVVQFGLKNMGVAPAGIDQPNTGHHHLLIDTELSSMDLPIPADAQHVHFGGGQTQTTVTLTPGEHTLQLVLGDFLHIPHDPPITSARISIIVTE